MKIIYLFIILSAVLACANGDNKQNAIIVSDRGIVEKPKETIRQIEPDVYKADSIQIIYYDDPNGDSLRYSRFFSYVEMNDNAKIQLLVKEFDKPFLRMENKRDCRSEGKLFLFNEQDVLKTVYFSTRGDSCSYMYFIKDGSFIYFPLSDKGKKFLNGTRRLAKNPL